MSVDSFLFSASQVRELDRVAIENHGLPSTVLMKRAGKAAFDHLLARWPDTRVIHTFCGGGNNGGDGYVIAALAAQRGLRSTVWQLSPKQTGAAQSALEYAIQEGVMVNAFDAALCQQALLELNQPCVIVDALLGTGTKGFLKAHYSQAIELINRSELPVLSTDIPSGVNPDTGTVSTHAVKAQLTVSFIGQKLGNVVGDGRLNSGDRQLSDLSVPGELCEQIKQPLAKRLDINALLSLLPSRKMDAHKGDFGHVLVVGGHQGYGGAPLMAARMAARSGAGLVGVATQPDNVPAIITSQPELMAAGVVSGQEMLPLLEKPSVLVLGPGLGQSAWSEQLLYHCLQVDKPMVVDADALNLIAQSRLSLPPLASRQWILTPHPGEAARLLNVSIKKIQSDRVAAVKALQKKLGGTVILKGAGSLVFTSNQRLHVCDAGNPGMASGGMGDVLSGLLGGLLGQGLSVDDAACLGVVLHASAADMAVSECGQSGLLATDLIPYVRQLLNQRDGIARA